MLRIPSTILTAVPIAILLASPAARTAGLPACRGPLEPPAPAACAAVDETGCCDEKGRLWYCDSGDLYCIDCGTTFPTCGWSGGGYYDCGASGPLPDPEGIHPIQCGGWDPLSIYVPDGWEIGVWRVQIGVPTAPRAFP